MYAGGSASGTVVNAGGREIVYADGSASGTVLSSGGVEVVQGTESGSTVLGGGVEQVCSGGVSLLALVGSGGLEFISAGGTISGGTIVSGGKLTLASGAILEGGLTLSGGTVLISAGVSAGQTLAFAGTGGDLVLADPGDFAATIAGFGEGDMIDLAGLKYASADTVSFAESSSLTSGTLTVTAGGTQVLVTLLGSYATGNFSLQNDGSGGTLVRFV